MPLSNKIIEKVNEIDELPAMKNLILSILEIEDKGNQFQKQYKEYISSYVKKDGK